MSAFRTEVVCKVGDKLLVNASYLQLKAIGKDYAAVLSVMCSFKLAKGEKPENAVAAPIAIVVQKRAEFAAVADRTVNQSLNIVLVRKRKIDVFPTENDSKVHVIPFKSDEISIVLFHKFVNIDNSLMLKCRSDIINAD